MYWRNLLAIAVAILHLSKNSQGSAKPFAAETITDVCGAVAALDKVGGVALQKQQALKERASAAAAAAEILWLAASAVEDGNLSTVFATAATKAAECRRQALNDLDGSLSAALLASSNAGRASGAVGELVDLLIKTDGGNGNGRCIATNSDGTKGNANGRYGCPPMALSAITPTQHKDSADLTPSGPQKLKGGDGGTQHAESASKCSLLAAGNNDASKLFQTSATAAHDAFYGMMTLTAHTTAATATITKKTLNNLGTRWQKTTPTTNIEKLYVQYGTVVNIPEPSCGQTTDDVITYALDPANSASLLKEAIQARSGTKITSGDGGATEAFKAAADNKTPIVEKLREKLTQTKAQKVEETSAKLTKIDVNSAAADIEKSLLVQHITNRQLLITLKGATNSGGC
ncbi:Trypanosome variant surface glycoprotein (A-type), putative [Trypanosoma equiperdum]|uniref:Trypanosome variant surface glycoprotein (A-type), putative n=1 Tax=Trypanosoma equiperdum TaxID=5694 RepID=A0A1G4HYZ2_TRYEQ|nr:Trypanosome variant surface glycoprotein (A-type), putative [Trypanosoma equiperdum]